MTLCIAMLFDLPELICHILHGFLTLAENGLLTIKGESEN